MPNNSGTKLEPFKSDAKIAMSQEQTRTWLAKGLFCFLAVLLIIVLILSIFYGKEYFVLLDSAISGIIGLLGLVVGFYFGSRK